MVFDRWSEVFVIRGKKMEHLKIIEKSIMAAQKSKDTLLEAALKRILDHLSGS